MKQKKTWFDDYDEDNYLRGTKDEKKRRPVRNWTKAFVDHQDDYDEYDDFHNTRIKS
jgi:hypothetical protein